MGVTQERRDGRVEGTCGKKERRERGWFLWKGRKVGGEGKHGREREMEDWEKVQTGKGNERENCWKGRVFGKRVRGKEAATEMDMEECQKVHVYWGGERER